jgi:uncharacterized protein (DUF1330 family)
MSNVDQPVYLFVAMYVKDLQDFASRYAVDVIGQFQRIGAELLAAGTPEVMEGTVNLNRAVVIRFPSRKVADEWYGSAEYAPLKKLRLEDLTTDGIGMFIEAFDPSVLG